MSKGHLKIAVHDKNRNVIKVRVTSWYSHAQKPVHIGWYETLVIDSGNPERQSPSDMTTGFMAFWDGANWCGLSSWRRSSGQSHFDKYRYQVRFWRGMSKRFKLKRL